MVVSGFLAGLFVPIDIFPTLAADPAELTPFPSMLMYPVDVLSGRGRGPRRARPRRPAGAGWLAATLGVGHLMTRAGRHRLEVQGG